jgi:hypothetical protein
MPFDPQALAQKFSSLKKQQAVISAAPKKTYKSPLGKAFGKKVDSFFDNNDFGRALKESFLGREKPLISEEEIQTLPKRQGITASSIRRAESGQAPGIVDMVASSVTSTRPERIEKRAEKLIRKDNVDQRRAYAIATEDVFLGRKTKNDFIIPKV